MLVQNARPVSFIGGVWPRQNQGAFEWELPKPAEWDQLLTRLGLNDSQALDAIKSDGEKGEQLRNFVLTFFRQYFIPEAVLTIARRHRRETQIAIQLANQPTAINASAVATTFGEQI